MWPAHPPPRLSFKRDNVRIGVDACCWSNRRRFGRFTRELVTHMISECGQHEFVLVVDRPTAEQCQFPAGAKLDVVDTRQQPTEAASAEGSRSPMDLWRMARRASRCPVDVFFFPAVYSFYPLFRRIPTAVTFHDAIAENHPDLIFPGLRSRLFWNLKTKLALRQADCLLTVSQSARSQFAAAFKYPEAAIHVINEGPGDEFRPIHDQSVIHDVLDRYQLPRDVPLILYVGGISPHKNLHGLLHAATRLRQQSQGPWHLVLVGDYKNDSFYGCFEELSQLSRQLELDSRVTFTGFVPNDHLVALYNAATMLVLPSFSEGFGLPVVEAMARGVPVAASRRGSLPEVLGEAGLLFDPEDHGDMARAIACLLEDRALNEKLRSQGQRRAELFSWKTAARDTIRLFEDMVNGTKRT